MRGQTLLNKKFLHLRHLIIYRLRNRDTASKTLGQWNPHGIRKGVLIVRAYGSQTDSYSTPSSASLSLSLFTSIR